MSRRRPGSASFGTLHRSYFSHRRFGDSIDQLTTESIEESLLEIEKIFQEHYGTKRRRKDRKKPAEATAE